MTAEMKCASCEQVIDKSNLEIFNGIAQCPKCGCRAFVPCNEVIPDHIKKWASGTTIKSEIKDIESHIKYHKKAILQLQKELAKKKASVVLSELK